MGSICTIIDHISPYVTFGKALGHIVANFRDYIIRAHSVKLDKPVLAVLLTHMDDEQLRHSSITNMWVSIKQVIVISSIITRHNNTVRIMNGGLHADHLDNFFLALLLVALLVYCHVGDSCFHTSVFLHLLKTMMGVHRHFFLPLVLLITDSSKA